MTRALLQQALDAVEAALSDDKPYIAECKEVAAAIRAALAASQVEPVAWQQRWTNPGTNPNVPPEEVDWKPLELKGRTEEETLRDLVAYRFDGRPCYEVRALYAAPPAPAPQVEPVAGEWRFDIDESNLYCGDKMVASFDNTECTNDSWREACRYGTAIATRMNAPPAPAAAQQVEPEPVAWMHDCAGLCTNDVELWIDACPHCGKPRTPAVPPAPATLMPLTEKQVDAIWDGVFNAEDPNRKNSFRQIITKAIEAHHGIGTTGASNETT